MDTEESELQGEPILVGPSGEFDMGRPVCLGCFMSLRPSASQNTCSKCKWPVCKYLCEKTEMHSKLECQILSKLAIPPSCYSYTLKFLFLLRAVMLQEKLPNRWDKLMKLQHEFSSNQHNVTLQTLYDTSVKFIHDFCQMRHVDEILIKRLVNIQIINSFRISRSGPKPSDRYYGLAIFERLSAIPHSCRPTLEWKITSSNTWTGIGKNKITLFLTEIRDPVPMESVSIARDRSCLLYGTSKRQLILKERYGFICECPRCSDPTEFGSFFSGILCQVCKTALMIPLKQRFATDPKTWKCYTCQLVQSDAEMQKIEAGAEVELNDILDSLSDDEAVAKLLEIFLNKFSGRILHQNHYLVIEAKRKWIECYSTFRKLETPGSEANQLYQRLTSRAQHLLQIYDILLPSPYLEPAMMIHFKLAIANKIFNRRYFLEKYCEPETKQKSNIDDQEGKIILTKALQAHSYDSLPKSPGVHYREIEIKMLLNNMQLKLD